MTPPPPGGTRVRMSVCMATYNGAEFVVAQIESILRQLGPTDEVVVVDDASTDDTVAVVDSIGDDRIRMFRSDRNHGHVAAFERAMREARGDHLLLADQDDLWPDGRVDVMLEALSRSRAVAGNQEEFPEPRPVRPAVVDASMDRRPLRNLVMLLLGRQPYFGCAMGVRRDLLPALLPFPSHVESHDHWIGMVAAMAGPFAHLDDVVVLRRVHGRNQTPSGRRPLPVVVRSRAWMLVAMARAATRARRLRASSGLS